MNLSIGKGFKHLITLFDCPYLTPTSLEKMIENFAIMEGDEPVSWNIGVNKSKISEEYIALAKSKNIEMV